MLFREREVGIRSAKFAKRVTLIRRACIGALPASLASRPPTFLVACPACPDGFGQGVLGAVKLGDQSKAFVPRELRKNHANSERLTLGQGLRPTVPADIIPEGEGSGQLSQCPSEGIRSARITGYCVNS